MTAPAFRNSFTTPASSGTTDLRRLKEPAVVFMPVIEWDQRFEAY